MAKRHVPADMTKIIGEMDGAPPRAAILVGASVLEYAVEELIEAHLRPTASAQERALLFSFNGVLGSFSDKILMAYYLRLIGRATRAELDITRTIRNECAHNMNPVSFNDAAIAARCRNLSQQRSPQIVLEVDPRKIFLATVAVLGATLLARAVYLRTGDATQPASGPEAQAFIEA